MQIRIKEDAKASYIRRCHAINWDWANMLEKVQGQLLEVETEYLFRDQFNTAPIPGVSDLGMRIMAADISEIIDDIRPSKIRCQWCGKISDATVYGDFDMCLHCGKIDYIKRFDEMLLWNGKRNA